MKRYLVIIISTILLITLFSGILLGCTAFSPIVGKWQDIRTQDTIEFTSGGDVIVKSGSFIFTGKYELVGSDIVKLRLEGWGALISLFGGDTWQYNISGNSMTVTVSGKSSVLKRVSN